MSGFSYFIDLSGQKFSLSKRLKLQVRLFREILNIFASGNRDNQNSYDYFRYKKTVIG